MMRATVALLLLRGAGAVAPVGVCAPRWAFHCQGEGGAHRGAPDPLERGDERRADRVDAQRLRNG